MLSSNRQIFYKNKSSLYNKTKWYKILKKSNLNDITLSMFLEFFKIDLITPNLFYLNNIFNPKIKNINHVYILNIINVIIMINKDKNLFKYSSYINEHTEELNNWHQIKKSIENDFLKEKLFYTFYNDIEICLINTCKIFNLIVKDNINVSLYAYSLTALNYLIYKKIHKEIDIVKYTKLKLFITERLHHYISQISPFLYNNFIIQNNYYMKIIFKKHKIKYG